MLSVQVEKEYLPSGKYSKDHVPEGSRLALQMYKVKPSPSYIMMRTPALPWRCARWHRDTTTWTLDAMKQIAGDEGRVHEMDS